MQDDSTLRAQLLRRIEALHPVSAGDGAQFVGGARLRLRCAMDEEAARRTVAELNAVGASAELVAHLPPTEAILALDQFADGEPAPESAAEVSAQLLAQLQPLDEAAAPATAEAPAPTPVAPLARETPVPRAAASSSAAAPDLAADEARFRPSGDWQQPMDLQLERPPPPPPPPPAAAADHETTTRPEGDDAGALPPSLAIDEWRPVPGRIAAGALRKNPAVRIALGVVLGLALGWLFGQPYARHAERRVAQLRAQADAERYRPVDEAQARVRQLDADADDAASNGALGMAVVWVLVGGAAFAGWWRAT